VNVGLAVTRSARRYPDAVAAFDDHRTVDYRTLDDRSSRLANALLDHYGIERGERVALLAHNRIEVVEVLCGCAKAGAVYVGLNFRLSQAEYEDILDNAEPRLIISEPEYAELSASLSERFGIPVLDLDGDYEALLTQASSRPPRTLHEIRGTDDFCLIYTSGTTGRPKGVLFDHGASLAHALPAIVEYEWTRDSRWLMMLPHNSSVNITMVPCLTIGAALGFMESRGFDGERFADAVARHQVTHTYLVPTMLFRLLEQVPTAERLQSMVTLGYGAAPIPPDRLRELVERYGPIFNQLYGMVEIASIGTMLRKEDHRRGLETKPRLLASCGQPGHVMDVRVVDDERNDVAPGERGEVIFGGPYLMKGYYRDEARTAEALIDGWMHSGDIAETDDENFIYIVDRKKDLIIRGGHNITPTEIENVIYEHHAVREAAVIGVPDSEWGESVLAVISVKEGAAIDPDELIAFCRGRELPSIKVPQRVEIIDALPKNLVGKIEKRTLRDAYWGAGRRV
jgi:acyl-CoA synthetase (AMP-forming)/AMP-acid ligase II